MSVPARQMNELFLQRLDEPGGKEKAAETGSNLILDRLREVSFARALVPPDPVTRSDCQVSVNHDTLVKIVFLEPRSRAMSMSFRGQPTTSIIRGPKVEVGFFKISSERFQKNESELLAYDFPITKVVEDNLVKDIQEVEDREFLIHCEAAVQALQIEANGGVATSLATSDLGTTVEYSVLKGELARNAPTDDATVRPIQRTDFPDLWSALSKRRLRAKTVLLGESDFESILKWTVEDQGDKLQSETAVDGWKYNLLLGRGYVRTIKQDILRPGNVYAITEPKYFAKFYLLNNLKFYVDKVADLISMEAWELIGMSLVNVASIVKMELYSGNANPNAGSSSLLDNFVPVDEDQLGAPNNRADQGLKFPNVVTL